MLVSLYTSRVILEALGVTDYGIYNVVGGFVLMFSVISSALTNSCSRFLNFEMGKGDQERLRLVFSTSVSIQYILALIVAIFCEVIGIWYINNVMVLPPDRLYAANWCFQFSIVSFCLGLISTPYNAAVIAHEKMRTFAYMSIYEGIAKLLICYIIIYQPYDRLIMYGFLMLIVSISIRIIYQVYCRIHFEECKYSFGIDKTMLKEMFAYSSWNMIGNTSAILKTQGVNVLLNYFFGPTVNAARGIATQVNNAVNGFVSNFMTALNPQITQSYAQNDLSYMFMLIYRGSRFSFYILLFLALPVLFSTDFILHVWLKTVPDYSVVFVILTLVTALICSLSKTLITAQNATGKVKNYQLLVGGIQLLIIPISLVVLLLGGSPVSVMVVAIFDEIVSLYARLYMISKNIVQFSSRKYVKEVVMNCISVSFFSMLVPFLLNYYIDTTLFSLIPKIIITLLSTSIVIVFVGCTRYERMYLFRKMISFMRK